jgi:ribose-phosphate pyrophosphokinase
LLEVQVTKNLQKKLLRYLAANWPILKQENSKMVKLSSRYNILIQFDGSVEGKHIILICSQNAPANDHVFETLLLVSSLKRNGASSVSLYVPYSAYARQDKMVGPWRSLAYSDIAHYYQVSGVDRVITLDIHNEAVMGCYAPTISATNLTAVKLAAKYVSKVAKLHNMVVLSPDEGGVKRAKKFYEEYLGQPDNSNKDSSFAIMLKSRSRPNEVASITINGDFTGKSCILIDDMIDTGVE